MVRHTCSYTKFQSRNRDTFRFKHEINSMMFRSIASFNLVIEILFVSSQHSTCLVNFIGMHSFNLVIEILFVSSPPPPLERNEFNSFQSRNRDTFRFKWKEVSDQHGTRRESFNLVIEILFVSSVIGGNAAGLSDEFQSRNRDTFRFKIMVDILTHLLRLSFNLVIEILFVSSQRLGANR